MIMLLHKIKPLIVIENLDRFDLNGQWLFEIALFFSLLIYLFIYFHFQVRAFMTKQIMSISFSAPGVVRSLGLWDVFANHFNCNLWTQA